MPPIADESIFSESIISLLNCFFKVSTSFALSASVNATAVVTSASKIPLYSKTSFSNFSHIPASTFSRPFLVSSAINRSNNGEKEPLKISWSTACFLSAFTTGLFSNDFSSSEPFIASFKTATSELILSKSFCSTAKSSNALL